MSLSANQNAPVNSKSVDPEVGISNVAIGGPNVKVSRNIPDYDSDSDDDLSGRSPTSPVFDTSQDVDFRDRQARRRASCEVSVASDCTSADSRSTRSATPQRRSSTSSDGSASTAADGNDDDDDEEDDEDEDDDDRDALTIDVDNEFDEDSSVVNRDRVRESTVSDAADNVIADVVRSAVRSAVIDRVGELFELYGEVIHSDDSEFGSKKPVAKVAEEVVEEVVEEAVEEVVEEVKEGGDGDTHAVDPPRRVIVGDDDEDDDEEEVGLLDDDAFAAILDGLVDHGIAVEELAAFRRDIAPADRQAAVNVLRRLREERMVFRDRIIHLRNLPGPSRDNLTELHERVTYQ